MGVRGMLQAGNSKVRFPITSLHFSVNPSSYPLALASTQPLTEMSIRKLYES
jgi:hypothetical protein